MVNITSEQVNTNNNRDDNIHIKIIITRMKWYLPLIMIIARMMWYIPQIMIKRMKIITLIKILYRKRSSLEEAHYYAVSCPHSPSHVSISSHFLSLWCFYITIPHYTVFHHTSSAYGGSLQQSPITRYFITFFKSYGGSLSQSPSYGIL